MFRAILFTQWLSSRLLLASGVLVAFTIPILAVQGAVGREPEPWQVVELLASVRAIGTLFPLAAAAVGLALGVGAWAADHRGGHVYALALPLARYRYVLLRFGAGGVMLIGPVFAVWIGSLVALSAATIPAGLQGYPHLLTLRFALAALLAYCTFFAIAASTPRTAGIIVAAILGVVATQLIALNFGAPDLLGPLLDGLFYTPGPLDVFGGNWMLIDV